MTPSKVVGDLQLANKKVTLNHLVGAISHFGKCRGFCVLCPALIARFDSNMKETSAGFSPEHHHCLL